MRSRLLAVVVGLLLVLVGGTQIAQAANILTNPGFESGSLSGWTCSGGSVVSSPVRSGGYALNGAVSGSDFAQCSQTVTVQSRVRRTRCRRGCAVRTSTWASPAAPPPGRRRPASYTQLTVSFTTGASQTSAQIYLHGWYGQPAYQADDVNLDGPGGNPPSRWHRVFRVRRQSPVRRTARSALSWGASTGTVTGYRVYEGSTVVKTVTGTSATIGGLAACTSHTYTVAAYNSDGESAKTRRSLRTTTGCTNTGLPKHALIGYLHASFANGSGYIRMADVPAAVEHHQPVLRRADLGDLRRHPVQPLPGQRVPERRERRRLPRRDQGETGRRARRC